MSNDRSMDSWQDPRYKKGKYAVVIVDEDNVRMSKFIEAKLHRPFEDGKAFYEATSKNEEDFLYYKKILRPEQKKVTILVLNYYTQHVPV